MSNKVVHLVYSFGCGGLEKVIANLITHSNEFDVEHIVISLTDDTAMVGQIPIPVEVIVLNKREGNDFTSHKKLYALLKKIKPRAINTYNFGTIEYHITAKLAGVPIRVHSDHGRGGDDPQGKNKLHNWFRKFIAHFITDYVVVSYDLYDWICNTLNINKAKVSLLFNGVVVCDCQTRTERVPKRYVSIGRLDAVKNQKLMINAFAHAFNTSPDFSECTLSIVGDGPLFQELAIEIERLKMTESIYLLGYREDIADILNDSDVFVLSSVYEAMPMTILESMANRIPVICTNVGGISQFISENEVWFVESNNYEQLSQKMLDLRELTIERQEKIAAAYRLVKEHYSVDSMVQNYMTKYQRI